MEFIIEGMRNPMNSWEKSDSGKCGGNNHIGCLNCSFAGDEKHNEEMCKYLILTKWELWRTAALLCIRLRRKSLRGMTFHGNI